MIKFDYGLPAALIGVSIALVQPQVAVALSSTEVGKIAEQITVRIEGKNSQGSGVIIKHSGDTYYVLTCWHVVAEADKYTIVTPDGESYPLDDSKVKKLQTGLDLAVVQFNSNKTYTVAKLGNSDTATQGTVAYVAGFPEVTAAIPNEIRQFIKGDITANASKPLPDGYALVYSNDTRPGMSGGPVLNENGEVVGIHGREDTTADQDGKTLATGFNLGIPINTFLASSSSVGVNLDISVPSPRPTPAATADNFYIQAGDKYKKGDYQGAIAAYNQAIQLNPNYADAYKGQGVARAELGDNQGALEDFNSALRLNPNLVQAYKDRGLVRKALGDTEGAIEDFNSALRLNPNFFEAYVSRGLARAALGDYQEAIEDYNQAIRIDPNYARAYAIRGVARAELGDYQEAIEDYNQAIRIDPNYARAYAIRAVARAELGDKQDALADLQRGAELAQQQGDTYLYQLIQKRIEEVQKRNAIEELQQ